MTFLKKLINDNQRIELEKFDGSDFIILPSDYHNDQCTKICFLDLETTGLNVQNCKIIEFAAKLTAIDNVSGELLGIVDEYQSFNDPEEIIDPVITRITGIDNSTVEGHSIDWESVSRLLDNADIIVAHNARFDRGVMDRLFPLSQEKVWLCSMKDINWMERGLNKLAQEILCIWHGFYYDSHRAMFDVDALIHLVTYNVDDLNNAVLELLMNATKPTYRIIALNSDFDKKDLLKERRYSWNPTKKYWWKNLVYEEIENEKEWMATHIYNGDFRGKIDEIALTDKHKF
tara:strand:+ start:51 stop:914 length:864 start_codon:yes stop_codon:yes gene_type:complete